VADIKEEEEASASSAKTPSMDFIGTTRSLLQQNWTMVKFAAVGASGVAVNLGVLYLLTTAFGNGLIIFFNALAVELSILNNFVWNDRFTFNSSSSSGRIIRLVKYNLLSLVSFSVNEVIFSTLYSVGLQKYLASLIAIGVSFLVNYFGSSRWAWRSSWLSSKERLIAKPPPAQSDAK